MEEIRKGGQVPKRTLMPEKKKKKKNTIREAATTNCKILTHLVPSFSRKASLHFFVKCVGLNSVLCN
jgi:hypothetical protein